jgi:hypothetical protein
VYDLQPAGLQQFAAACLTRAGALVESRGYALLEAVLPPELAQEMGDSHLVFAFDVEVAEEVPGSRLASHGSPLLDRLVSLATGFDRYFALYAPLKELRPPRDIDRRLADVHFERCRPPRVTQWWTQEHIYWGFCFRASFRSNELTEELVEAVVDGSSGNLVEDFPSLWRGVVPTPGPEGLLPRAGQLPVEQLYTTASTAAGAQARTRARTIQQAGAAMMDRELAKVRRYHEEIAGRIQKQLGSAEDPGRQARLQQQLQATVAEAGRRAQDTLARFQVEVELSLDHVVAHHLPCLHLKVDLAHRSQMLNRTLIYDPLAGRVLAPRCEVCGEPSRRLIPDVQGRLACPLH